jgi:alkylation response protein AidB-like acyl-CoA dehydrogenase
MWTTGMHVATHCALFARTSGNDGDRARHHLFLVPAKQKAVKVEEYMWTFNMPTDHPRVSFTDVFVPEMPLFGEIGRGCRWRNALFMRTGSAGRKFAGRRGLLHPGKREIRPRAKTVRPRAGENQAIQWPLVELATQARCCGS